MNQNNNIAKENNHLTDNLNPNKKPRADHTLCRCFDRRDMADSDIKPTSLFELKMLLNVRERRREMLIPTLIP
jgi:hypothetical protein